MSLTLGTIITAARDRHPAFHRSRLPDAVLARFLSDYQNELIGKALGRDRFFLAQSASIALAVSDANDPGTVGVGTAGGLPAEVSDLGVLSVVQESAGQTVEPLLTGAEGGVVALSEGIVTAATTNTISRTGAGRTTNQDQGRFVHITAGTGRGQVREIASNSATQWTVTANWTTVPDTTSMFAILMARYGNEDALGVITEIPSESSQTGYLVRLNAQGTPYVDFTAPLTVRVDHGVPLPTNLALLGGTVRYADGTAEPLALTTFGRRFDPPRMPAVYQMGQDVFLCGEESDWQDVQSVEFKYAPVAPAFTRLTDYFLVPDGARPSLVAAAAAFAAGRTNGLDGFAIDTEQFAFDAKAAEKNYLSTIRIARRARLEQMPEGAY